MASAELDLAEHILPVPWCGITKMAGFDESICACQLSSACSSCSSKPIRGVAWCSEGTNQEQPARGHSDILMLLAESHTFWPWQFIAHQKGGSETALLSVRHWSCCGRQGKMKRLNIIQGGLPLPGIIVGFTGQPSRHLDTLRFCSTYACSLLVLWQYSQIS